MIERDQGKAQKKDKFTPQEAAEYLRQLADDLEAGIIVLDEDELDINGEVKLKQSLKMKEDKSSLKFKLKVTFVPPKPESEATPAGVANTASAAVVEASAAEDENLPSYKKLKKNMAKQFKEIRDALEAGSMPGEELAASFCENCRLMTIHPGKGDPYYPHFRSATQSFKFAVEAGDLEDAKAAVEELKQLKTDCHDRFK